MINIFWNNKGGTGKTSLLFQSSCRYATIHPEKKVLVIDLCPQANLSELMLGGIQGNGGCNLRTLLNATPKKSIAGYIDTRFPHPFNPSVVSNATSKQFIITPNTFNENIPTNIDLLAGDSNIELQSIAMSTLANTQLPGTNTWLAVIDWLKDFILSLGHDYDDIFIDTNPSFSIYTQMGVAASDRIIVPLTADDSSRRGLQNVLALVYGHNIASTYAPYAFSTHLNAAGRQLPKIHLVVKNRLTQYMGTATAYDGILSSIDNDLNSLLASNPQYFTFTNITSSLLEIRDFQTTGVVTFSQGNIFCNMTRGRHSVLGNNTIVNQQNIDNCLDAIDSIVNLL